MKKRVIYQILWVLFVVSAGLAIEDLMSYQAERKLLVCLDQADANADKGLSEVVDQGDLSRYNPVELVITHPNDAGFVYLKYVVTRPDFSLLRVYGVGEDCQWHAYTPASEQWGEWLNRFALIRQRLHLDFDSTTRKA